MAQIRVSRDDPNGAYRSMRIVIDGEVAFELGRKDERSVYVSAGTHTVQARMDWAASAVVTVKPDDGEEARLETRLPIQFWQVFTRPKSSIYLAPR